MKQVILYGIAGADKHYRILRYFVIGEEFISISNIMSCAHRMVKDYPEIKRIFAIDNRYGLRRDYVEAYTKDSIESGCEFVSILESEGIQII